MSGESIYYQNLVRSQRVSETISGLLCEHATFTVVSMLMHEQSDFRTESEGEPSNSRSVLNINSSHTQEILRNLGFLAPNEQIKEILPGSDRAQEISRRVPIERQAVDSRRQGAEGEEEWVLRLEPSQIQRLITPTLLTKLGFVFSSSRKERFRTESAGILGPVDEQIGQISLGTTVYLIEKALEAPYSESKIERLKRGAQQLADVYRTTQTALIIIPMLLEGMSFLAATGQEKDANLWRNRVKITQEREAHFREGLPKLEILMVRVAEALKAEQ